MPLWVAAAPPSFPARRQPPLPIRSITFSLASLHRFLCFTHSALLIAPPHSASPKAQAHEQRPKAPALRAITVSLAEAPSARAVPQGPCSAFHNTQPRRRPLALLLRFPASHAHAATAPSASHVTTPPASRAHAATAPSASHMTTPPASRPHAAPAPLPHPADEPFCLLPLLLPIPPGATHE